MLNIVKQILISGKSVWPVIEGGKGIGISSGITAGSFAAAGAVGTFSGVNAQYVNGNGELIPLQYETKTRKARHEELMNYSINAAISQAKIAHDVAGDNGRIHMNVLWEMGGAQRVLHGVLEKAKHLIHGITCGAGMPYKLAEIAAKYKVYYYPIISSLRAFRALWRRSYGKVADLLGGIVYEDPWLAGGHNGLSNDEDPSFPIAPHDRLFHIRKFMNEVGLSLVPIIMAGGVWHLKDWLELINDDEIGPLSFQFGTRPLLTKESPISDEWKKRLLTLKKGDVFLNRFSPTGFYSSAVNNDFIRELKERFDRQIPFRNSIDSEFNCEILIGNRARKAYVTSAGKKLSEDWVSAGYTDSLKTPDDTLIFVTPEKANEIHCDQIECMGCLSHCKFSNWKDHDDYTTGKKVDPRSFCIQKTLQEILQGNNIENQLMFSGHNAYKFAHDPFYDNGFIPTVRELVDRILVGK
ncbi:MAG: nitronate monooxygenase [Rickettsiaceae bacterium H1]|nr:nitronate monooxygenase [Rickettsiaceae bacterium H1]